MQLAKPFDEMVAPAPKRERAVPDGCARLLKELVKRGLDLDALEAAAGLVLLLDETAGEA